MQAWVGEREGKNLSYHLAEVAQPVPGPMQVLIRVRAVGLNLVDRFPKRAHFQHSPPAPANIPGMEVAGEIAALGAGVRGFETGERVMAMVHGGAAPYAIAQAPLLMRVPPAMSWTDAAAIPVSFLTAHDALVTNGRLPKGGALLVQGVTTAAGLAAVKLARLRGASWIAGSSRSAEKLRRVGLDLPIVTPDAQLAEKVLVATHGRGADVVVDHLGASVLNETLKATALGGRVVNVGRFAGVRGEIDLEVLALRRIALVGVTFRTRSLEEHAAVVSAFLLDHAGDLTGGALVPVVDRVFDFKSLPQAIERAARGDQFGKLVVSLE